MKIKKILAFVFIVIMFLIVASLDTQENTSKKDIASAKVQAELNRESRCK